MQRRQGFFSGNWQLKASAILASVFTVMMLSTYITAITNDPEIPAGDFWPYMGAMATFISPLLFGCIFNWVGAVKETRAPLIFAIVFYVLAAIMFALMLPAGALFALLPLILVSIGLYKMKTPAKLKPPRHL